MTTLMCMSQRHEITSFSTCYLVMRMQWFKEDGKYLERLFGSWEPSYYHKYTGTWRGGWMLLLCALVVGIPLYIVKRRCAIHLPTHFPRHFL